MSVLRTLRKLVLGETWTLPLGVTGVVLVGALVVKPLLGATWDTAGGLLLAAGMVVVLVVSVFASSGR